MTSYDVEAHYRQIERCLMRHRKNLKTASDGRRRTTAVACG
ncbi:hypothetical protein C5F59_004745 [Streptomyces sp. QL37]|nr:hypothetical protein [Streptomyces sp. QL37]